MISTEPIYAPVIGFFSTLAIMFYLGLSLNIRQFKSIKKIRKLCENEGKQWEYWYNLKLRLEMFRDPRAVFEPDDSVVVKLAKEELVQLRWKMRRSVPKGIGIAAIGMFLTVLLTILEAYIRAKL